MNLDSIKLPHRPALLAAILILSSVGTSADAQWNDNWVTYQNQTSGLLGPSSTAISDSNTEVDFAWGDLDKDGFVDVVVVRKQPFTSPGKRTNILLMNENGVLQDRTSLYATDADVPGDNGFNTPTNDRDVWIDDFDQDGWDDFVTATTLSDGDPKHIGHPRVYMNKGYTGAGVWKGMRFEDARFPQFLHYGTGNPENPRFCSVATGDVTGNGYPDLYFGDYDSSGAGGSGQPSNKDLNDRLCINDGFGFFTDQSQLRMTSTMLKSAFGNSVEIADYNLDGANDILKDTALNAPQYVAISYNNPSNEGFFNLFDDFHTGFAPYHTSGGDLNNDGRRDIIVSDDGSDRYRFNTGTDVFGRAVWSSAKTFSFQTGSDDGFGSNNLVADLDNDGFEDALIADVDVDIGGFSRRLHIYRNKGGPVGSTSIQMKEEAGDSSQGNWRGVEGMTSNDLKGTHDVAVFDIDNDGDKDMLVGRSNGTHMWENQLDPACPPAVNYGFGEICSKGTLAEISMSGTPTQGNSISLDLTGGNTNSFMVMFTATAAGWVPQGWGVIQIGGSSFRTYSTTDANGEASITVPVDAALVGKTRYYQYIIRDPGFGGNLQHSNGIKVTFCP